MKKFVAFSVGIGLSIVVQAQEDTLAKNKNLDEVIIYSSKFAERKKTSFKK